MTTPQPELDLHRPTDAFRGYLEWELDRTVRRGRRMRHLRTIAVVLVSAGFGMSATIASAQIRQGTTRDSLMEAARADAAMVALRLGLVQAQLEDYKKRVAAGVSSPEDMVAQELQLIEVTAEGQRVDLNMKEIELSSSAPRDELNAPLVSGRDFVRERLEGRLMTAQYRLSLAESSLTLADQRYRSGAASEQVATDAGLDVERAKRDLGVLAAQLDLRREFIAKSTPIADLTRRLEQSRVRLDLVVAQKALKAAESRAALVERQRTAGVGNDVDMYKSKLDVLEQQIQVQRLVKRLQELGG